MHGSSILVIGELARPEFSAVQQTATDLGAGRQRNVRAALAGLRAGEPPELIVLLQAAPGEHRPEELEELQRAAPLARWVLVFGAWSEGETRTGRPWPGAPRIAAHRWAGWWDLQQARLGRGEPAGWELPPTMTDEERQLERLGATEDPSASARSGGLRVGIYAHDRAWFTALAEVCEARGHAAIKIAMAASAAEILEDPVLEGPATERTPIERASSNRSLDCDVVVVCGRSAEPEIERLAAQLAGRVWFALVDFPRWDDTARLRELGAAAVFAKPLYSDELWAQIERLAPRRSDPSH
ncbi:MAG TPA: hypothetical protein VFE24_17030 [Pirellulales bacterium]|jgi:hypothetical protein|nr:hypothetical protein [Pirellulales bacterium]